MLLSLLLSLSTSDTHTPHTLHYLKVFVQIYNKTKCHEYYMNNNFQKKKL